MGRGVQSDIYLSCIFFLIAERVGVKVIDKTKLDEKTTKMLLREIKVIINNKEFTVFILCLTEPV